MTNPTLVAVTSRSFSRHPVLRAELLERYSNVTFNDDGLTLRDDALVDYLSGHEKAIIALESMTEEIVSRLPDLRLISKVGVGLDSIDLDALRRHDIQLAWSGGTNKRSVSELVLAFAISMLRHVTAASRELRGGTWRQQKGRTLSGQTVGIVGCGHVGKDLVQLLQPFGCEILCYDVVPSPEFYAEYRLLEVGLDELLGRADVISLHLPLNDSTQNIINAERLGLIKPTSILINTSRGQLVDEQALKERLKAGKLSGAAFDVFATEPPNDLELLDLPNFLGTPHIGGSTEEAILAMGRAAIDGLDADG